MARHFDNWPATRVSRQLSLSVRAGKPERCDRDRDGRADGLLHKRPERVESSGRSGWLACWQCGATIWPSETPAAADRKVRNCARPAAARWRQTGKLARQPVEAKRRRRQKQQRQWQWSCIGAAWKVLANPGEIMKKLAIAQLGPQIHGWLTGRVPLAAGRPMLSFARRAFNALAAHKHWGECGRSVRLLRLH